MKKKIQQLEEGEQKEEIQQEKKCNREKKHYTYRIHEHWCW